MRKAMLHAPTRSPIWLSHHWPDRHDRCVRVRGVAVCRRCLVLYPLVLLAALVVLAVDLPLGAIVVAAWILPLPMSLEWAGEQFGVLAHSPRRLVVTTAVAALGLGAALAVHLRTPFHLDVLAPVATHVTICAVSSIRAARGRTRGWSVEDELRHRREEAEREHSLRLLLAEGGREASRSE